MSLWLHVKYLLFLLDFNETRISSADFRKNTQALSSIATHPVEAEFFLADRRTYGQMEIERHVEANSRFQKFCERA